MTNDRWLKWAIARYYRSHGYKVTMKPARAGNAMVDGVAVSPDGERTIETGTQNGGNQERLQLSRKGVVKDKLAKGLASPRSGPTLL